MSTYDVLQTRYSLHRSGVTALQSTFSTCIYSIRRLRSAPSIPLERTTHTHVGRPIFHERANENSRMYRPQRPQVFGRAPTRRTLFLPHAFHGIEWPRRASTHAPRHGRIASPLKVEWRSRPHHLRNRRARHARPRVARVEGVASGQSAPVRRTPRRISVTWLAAADSSSRSQSQSSSVVPVGLVGSYLTIPRCPCSTFARMSPFVLCRSSIPNRRTTRSLSSRFEEQRRNDPRRTYAALLRTPGLASPSQSPFYTLCPFPTLRRPAEFSDWNTWLTSLGAGTIRAPAPLIICPPSLWHVRALSQRYSQQIAGESVYTSWFEWRFAKRFVIEETRFLLRKWNRNRGIAMRRFLRRKPLILFGVVDISRR